MIYQHFKHFNLIQFELFYLHKIEIRLLNI